MSTHICRVNNLTGCPSHQLVEARLRISEPMGSGVGQRVICSFLCQRYFEVLIGDVYSYALSFHRVRGLNCERTTS